MTYILRRCAAVLLGLPESEGYYSPSPVDGYAEQPGKAAHAILAVVLAGMELATGTYTWRNPSSTAVRYFSQIAAWVTRCPKSSRSSSTPRPRCGSRY